jgi:sugar lactone lactonase YvrE
LVGPTGLAYDPEDDVLYVASTADNEIFAVKGAATATSSSGPGKVIYRDQTHLHGPLGLILAPNGHLISSQGDAINPDPAHNSEIVEFTKSGKFVTQFSIDSAARAAFGIAIAPLMMGWWILLR